MNDEQIQKEKSPRSPKTSLADAIELVGKLYAKANRAGLKREVAVGPLGYSSLNGAAMSALAGLTHYGLIDQAGGLVTVSSLAVKLIHPINEQQTLEARKEAALKPKVFSDLFTGGFHECSEEVLASHLIQGGFAPDIAKKVARVYKENSEFAKLKSGDYNASHDPKKDTAVTPPLEHKNDGKPALEGVKLPLTGVAPSKPNMNTNPLISQLPIPLAEGLTAIVPYPMAEDDFNLLLETLKLWKKKLIQPMEKAPSETFPFAALWKNADFDKTVKIVGVMGEREGQKYYQTEDGTGIPEKELFPNK
ncbi:MAG TPA: hypothetical protein VH413_10865 [Verrucomicrobiae bacterium]|jgi:hypothetical protein|nr:hypothetical protein [Verrucomicrobiae bacterium]